EVEYIGRPGGLDTRFAPHFRMAAACTGPRAANIHGIDEYVELSSVIQVSQVLAMMILNWCGVRE
ncbi:MAG: acetylornithine deacetylase, partial [candidate division NC10 bacterium]